MAKRSRKTFKAGIGTALDAAAAETPALDKILNGIPIAGDDILAELLDATSDRTAAPAELAAAEIVPAPGTEASEPLPEDLGEETGAAPEFVERVEAVRQKTGRSLEEAEDLVKREMPPPEPAGMRDTAPPPEPEPVPLTPQDTQLNGIAAREMVEWYDVLQSVASLWAYDRFSTPQKAAQSVEELYPKIAAGRASDSERALYEQAQQAVLGFTRRKTAFSEQVAMSETLKERTVRLLDNILQARQVRISPELLLGFLLLTPLIVNGGKILLEKIGFGNADAVLDKFTAFVSDQEAAYYDQK
jgi:hypothetical protein